MLVLYSAHALSLIPYSGSAPMIASKKFSATLLFLFLLLPTVSSALPILPGGPQVAAKSYILQDFYSGRVLLESNADLRVEPASLTKLMTAYIAFNELQGGHIKLTDKVRISEKAWRMDGSRMYIEHGSEVTVEELLKGIIIQSGNDASVALAEHIAGSEESFAEVMNQYAKKLGMTNTNYINTTGMPGETHYTSARDMAIIAAALIRQFPDFYKYYSEREYTYNNITQHNRNTLLWQDESVDGLKTGYTEAAGYCLVTSAKQKNMRLIAVVMGTAGAKARASETRKMLTYGFRFFETHELYKANSALDKQRVWRGEVKEVQLGLEQALYVTVPRGQYKSLKAGLQVEKQIFAPVLKGTKMGTVKVTLDDKILADLPLVALHDVKEGNWFQRILDYVLIRF